MSDFPYQSYPIWTPEGPVLLAIHSACTGKVLLAETRVSPQWRNDGTHKVFSDRTLGIFVAVDKESRRVTELMFNGIATDPSQVTLTLSPVA